MMRARPQVNQVQISLFMPDREIPIVRQRVHQIMPIRRDTRERDTPALLRSRIERIDLRAEGAFSGIKRECTQTILHLFKILRHLPGFGRTEIQGFPISGERGECLKRFFPEKER